MEKRTSLRIVTRTAVLFALTLAVQMLGFPQMVTGPLVNACLLLAAIFAGVISGVVIGLFTPWVALLRGILPPVLGPMVPFIMMGNGALVIIFGLLRRKRGLPFEIAGVILGAFVKYLLLSQAVRTFVKVPPAVAQAMQLPQLVNALLGGALALVLAQAVQRVYRERGRS